MAKQDKQKAQFELTQFKPEQIVDFSEWEKRQQTLLAENPFIETTPETYDEARRRRTALVTGRTSLQKERDAVKKELNNAKTFVVKKYDEFIDITRPAEEKQQESVKSYEAILEAEKEKERLADEKRVNDIRALIDGCAGSLDAICLKMTFETIDESQQQFDATIDSGEYDPEVLQEFEFLFKEMIESQQEHFDQRVKQVTEDHQRAVQELETQQKSKVDEMFRKATELIDSITPDNVVDIKEKVHGLFETEFDFGKFKDQFESVAHRMFQKLDREMLQLSQQAIEREKQQRENELNIQKNRIIDVREGLLDLVFQMTADNFPEEKKKIREKLKAPEKLLPELQGEWTKMTERVDHSMKQKIEVLANEVANRQKEIEIRTEQLMNTRPQMLKDAGFDESVEDVFNLNDEFVYDIDTIIEMSDVEFDTVIADANAYVEEKRIHAKRWNARKPEVEKIGFEYDEENQKFIHSKYNHFGFPLDQLLNKDQENWDGFISHVKDNIEKQKQFDKTEKARQKKLKADKENLTEWVNHAVRKNKTNIADLAGNQEMKDFHRRMVDELNAWCDAKVDQIKKF